MTLHTPRLVLVMVLAAPLVAPATAQAADRSDGTRPGLAAEAQRNRAEQTDRFTRTFKVGADGQVFLGNIAGDIKVTAGGAGEVTIEVVRTARARSPEDAREQLALVEVEVTERAGRVEARTRYPHVENRSMNVSVDYTVTAPPGVRVQARSISGDISLTGITGAVNAETTSGEVVIQNGARAAQASSISGNVEIQGVDQDGTLEASSVSGDVRVRDVKVRRLDVSSTSGDVEVGPVTCQTAELKSTSGDVDYTGALQRGGRYEFRTHSGTVRVTISGDIGFELDASSFSGSIDSELPITIGGTTGGRSSRRSVRDAYGEGGASLEVSAFSGDVIIRKR